MARAAPLFLGPPEEESPRHERETPRHEQPAQGDQEDLASNEFLDLLKKAMPLGGTRDTFINSGGHLMGYTENMSATYLSSGNACLDFFFKVVPHVDECTIESLLRAAWKEDPLQALKLVCHLRGVRGLGKSDKQSFYHAAVWLQKRHSVTLRENMEVMAEFGYYKDLLELIVRLVEGPTETERKAEAKAEHSMIRRIGKKRAQAWQLVLDAKKTGDDPPVGTYRCRSMSSDGRAAGGYYSRKGAAARAAKMAGTLRPREERVAAALEADRAAKERAAALRKEKRSAAARRVAKIYSQDSEFQALYLKVAAVFSERLKEDLKALKEGRLFDISLAAKWAPSLDGSHDLRTLLCYSIATQIFPKEVYPEYEDMDDRKYGFVVRDRLRKEVLVPLRKALEVPEVSMSAQKWGEVNYRRVASVAMKNYKQLFLNHDQERFTQYLEDVKAGKQKIAAGALLPHEIVRGALNDDGSSAHVAELQWKRMVEDLKQKGSISNCLAVCDVSGSMSGEPMEVCVALGILLSDLCEEPWKNHVITFSQNPEIHVIRGDSLAEKYSFTVRMEWDMNTNFQGVFDKILAMAQSNNLAPEKMIRRLFVFSDMEFDEASTTPWETDYAAISRKFRESGYGTPPEIVFWNLIFSDSTPVVDSQSGVALVSGFSKNIMKMFLQNDGVINPLLIMQNALEGEEYSKLKVVD